MPARPLVTISSHDRTTAGACGVNIVSGATLGAWPSANRALYMPIYLSEPGTVVKLWLVVGVAAGNVDIGIYSENYARIVSAGTTAAAGSSAIQSFDITDTFLPPGRYYLGVVASDVATATFAKSAPLAPHVRMSGVLQQASALPLPNPMVPASPVSQYIPLAGLSYRVTI